MSHVSRRIHPSTAATLALALATGLAAAAGCNGPSAVGGDTGTTSSTSTGGQGGGAGGSTSTGKLTGACTVTNPFSKGLDCKEYTGAAWTEASAAADCQSSILGAPGTFAAGASCSFPDELGTCAVSPGDGTDYLQVSAGSDAGSCSMAKTACEVFAKGTFTPGGTCDGSTLPPSEGAVFVQPYQVCKDPLPGEPPGAAPGGQVCTWTLVSASTEAGRHFQDYASCADVHTQRPYWAAPPAGQTDAGDARLADTAYMAEVAWARSQVEASACVCCHSSPLAPEGPSQWFVEAPGVWLDSIADDGLAMLAGLVSSEAFGAFPAAENNGFDRTALGMPTTDVPRMEKLLLGEWTRRGHTVADAATIPPFGGPLVDQLAYQPSACAAGQGVAADGTVSWTGGSARYLYVLDAGSRSPGVPPNLDMPAGTRWLVDVPTKGTPFASGVRFGELTGDMKQRLPASGKPSALESGRAYYLYVMADMALPITRCLFTAP